MMSLAPGISPTAGNAGPAPRRPARWLRMAAAVVLGLGAVMLVATVPDTLAAAPPDPWAARMATYAAEDLDAPRPPHGVVFVGSSSISGWREVDHRLAHLNPVRRGLDGATLAAITERTEALVLPHAPRLVIVYAGDNDLAAGATPEQVLGDWQALVARVHASLPDTRIAFLSIKPSPRRAAMLQRLRRANSLVAADVARDPRLSFIDVQAQMLDARGRPRPELFRDDGLHLNEAGYALWTEALATRLN